MFNRQSVQDALQSLAHRLGQFKKTPPNGLAIFCGYGHDAEGKQKKIVTVIEPYRPLPHSMYKCDSRFHTEMLRDQLVSNSSFGFIVVDGNGVSFHILTGQSRETLFKWTKVSLPKKHGRGGQSKNRFERIREEKRLQYVVKVSELATKYFIDPVTTLPNVQALILAGSADLKHDLNAKLDGRLAKIVVAVVDVQYGGEVGFAEAVNQTEAKLKGVKYVREKQALGKFFDMIAKDTGLYVFGVEATIYALESGTLDTLLLWDQIPIVRYTLKSVSGEEQKVVYSMDKVNTKEWSLVSSTPLIDWILEHYKEFGAKIELVSEQTSVGTQFVKGFGGIGGILRFAVELLPEEEQEEDIFEW